MGTIFKLQIELVIIFEKRFHKESTTFRLTIINEKYQTKNLSNI
jgi:hypothetical protein